MTHIKFGADDASQAIRHIVAGEKVKNSQLLDRLTDTVARHALRPAEIELLTWAASKSAAIEILSWAHQLEAGAAMPLAAAAESPQAEFTARG